jgi:hypothetical protein
MRTALTPDPSRRRALALAALMAFAGAFGAAPRPAGAQEQPKITITVDQAWLRDGPSLVSGNSVPVAKGEFYEVIGRTPDAAWLRLAVPGAKAERGTWLFADLGAAYSGDPKSAPVLEAPARAPARGKAIKAAPMPTYLPAITPQQRAIYRQSAARGKDLNFFTVVGDCNSQPSVFLQRLASGQFDASRLDPKLQAIVQRFSRSFGRVSLAAQGGFGAGMMMDPTWADGALCDVAGGQGPFACELWVSRASVVFIALGTQEQYDWQNFEANYRPMIEHAQAKGVLPVLVTKADDIETASGAPSGHINGVIRKLAQEYGVPLLDYAVAARALPNNGLIDEGDKDFHLSDTGMDLRILTALQTLAAIVGDCRRQRQPHGRLQGLTVNRSGYDNRCAARADYFALVHCSTAVATAKMGLFAHNATLATILASPNASGYLGALRRPFVVRN